MKIKTDPLSRALKAQTAARAALETAEARLAEAKEHFVAAKDKVEGYMDWLSAKARAEAVHLQDLTTLHADVVKTHDKVQTTLKASE